MIRDLHGRTTSEGRLKMLVYCKGTARIRHKTTGSIHEVESNELDWDQVGSHERQMGPEIHYDAVIEHPELGTLTWSLWEYPLGIENYNQTELGEHELIEDFDYGLEPEPDDWVDYDIPDSPFDTFTASYHDACGLLAAHGRDDGRYLLNRMIFSHQVTALEAYLGDTLMKALLANKEAMTRLMTKDAELLKERYSLAEIAGNADLVETKVREYLRSILYHNLEKVNFLYSTALQVRILDLAQDKARLLKTITLRHDCVHRNGSDKDGNELTVFTKQFVQDTADLIRDFVAKIEWQLRS
jgi:hypothetical protein